MMEKPFKFAVVGLDHRHIYGMVEGMMNVGGTFVEYWTDGTPQPLEGFEKRFEQSSRVHDLRRIFEDPQISLILIASKPEHRAELAIEAMRHGKDVMVDKPGCITLDELDAIEDTVTQTGRIWSVNFSERFEVRSVTRASQLVKEGRIGNVVQTIGIGPHRMNADTRPDWFFDSSKYGGILGDIASHQIDQFLHFANISEAEIVHSAVGNFNNPQYSNFEDFGEVNLIGKNSHAYIRVDWYTPNALHSWGDGRLFILGSEGYIELRKYVDVCGRGGADHLFLVNGENCEYMDCCTVALPYFGNLANDIADRTETACQQSHTFTVTRLALQAQAQAMRRGNLAP